MVFIHYDGLAPRKLAKSNIIGSNQAKARAPAPSSGVKRWADALGYAQAVKAVRGGASQVTNAGGAVLGALLNISYPEYAPMEFQVAASAVQADAGYIPAEVVEDVHAIASRDLADRVASLKARSMARGALKLAGQAVAQVDASQSEFADVRGWLSLPSRIRMARLKLKPGKHRVTARFLDASGAVIATSIFEDVMIRTGRRTWLQFKTAR